MTSAAMQFLVALHLAASRRNLKDCFLNAKKLPEFLVVLVVVAVLAVLIAVLAVPVAVALAVLAVHVLVAVCVVYLLKRAA